MCYHVTIPAQFLGLWEECFCLWVSEPSTRGEKSSALFQGYGSLAKGFLLCGALGKISLLWGAWVSQSQCRARELSVGTRVVGSAVGGGGGLFGLQRTRVSTIAHGALCFVIATLMTGASACVLAWALVVLSSD